MEEVGYVVYLSLSSISLLIPGLLRYCNRMEAYEDGSLFM